MALQNVEANITLDLYNHDTTPATVKAIQLDSQTRYVAAMLQNAGAQYDVDSGATIQLIVVRPDNVGVQITGETFEYGEEGAQFLGPYAELTQVALAVSGKMRGQFKITSGTQILRTEIFAINNGVALDASTDEWADEYDGYNLEEMATSIETNTTDIASLEADVSQIKEDFTELKSGLNGVKEELGLVGKLVDYGTANPLIIDAPIGTVIDLEFTTASSYLEVGKNLIPDASQTFIQHKKYELPIKYPAGTYVFSCVAVSADTDKDKCQVGLYNGTQAVTNLLKLPRGVRTPVIFTASDSFDRIYLYASDDYAGGAGDEATFSDMQLERGTALTEYEAYSGVIRQTSVTRITARMTNFGLYSDDLSAIHGTAENGTADPIIPKLQGEIDGLKASVSTIKDTEDAQEVKIKEMEDDISDPVWAEVPLTLTNGTFYKPDGSKSAYASAKSSDPIPVTAREELKVTAYSQKNVPSILFYNSNTPSTATLVSIDCYTETTTQFTDELIIVPEGAIYAIVEGNVNHDVVLKKRNGNVSKFVSLSEDIDYADSLRCRRLMALGSKMGLSWGTYPRMQLTLRVDDLRTDVDKIAKIVMDEYDFPLVVAACVKEINKTVTGIAEEADKIGNTRLEVCQWVQEHGGEIVVHPDTTYTSADQIQNLFIDSMRTFESNGVKIRGTAVANTSPNAILKKSLDPYLYGYYDYSDNYGTLAPYTGISTEMIRNFNDSVSAFESWLNARTPYSTPIWKTIVMHQLNDDVSESTLRSILDIIQTNVSQGKVDVVLWSDVYDTYLL